MKMEYTTEIVFLVISLTNFASSGVCPISTPTVAVVPRCPVTQVEMEEAARRKKCDIMANTKNCDTTPVYHCLLNQWRNETLEVCASPWYISGFCAIYDTVRMKVIDDFTRDCTTFSEGECPTRYHSPEAYKYQNCYNKTKNTSSQSLTDNQNNQFNDCPSSIPAIVIASVFTSIFAVLFILTQMGKIPIIVDRINKKRKSPYKTASVEKGDSIKKERESHQRVSSLDRVYRNTNEREKTDKVPLLLEEGTKEDKTKVVYNDEDIHKMPDNKSAEKGLNGSPGNLRIQSRNEPSKYATEKDKPRDSSKDELPLTVGDAIKIFEGTKDDKTKVDYNDEGIHKTPENKSAEKDCRKQTDGTAKTYVGQTQASEIGVENQDVHSADEENSIEDHPSSIDDKECDRTPNSEHEHEETHDESSTISEEETVQNTSENVD